MGKLNKEAEDQKKVFKHCTHDHPIELTKILNTNEALCSGCRINILPGEDCFACMPCQFFLHKRCFELPQKIRHPADSNHDLILILSHSFQCKACGSPGSGFSYNCSICPQDIHSLCIPKPISIRLNSHPHFLNLKYKTPYKGEEGFSCDLCAQPGTNQWLYCCQQCHYDVHLHCVQTGANFEASCRSRSLENVKAASLVNATTYVSQSVNLPCGVQGNFHNIHAGNISVANQSVLVSPNAMTISDTQAPLNTTTPAIAKSQYRLNATYIGQSGNFSNGFQASCYPFSSTTASSTMQPIPMSPNGTTVFTTRAPINNITNPAMGVPQSKPSAAFANQGTTTFPNGSHAYSNNGVVYLSAAQGTTNQPIFLRPNGGGAPTAVVIPQNQGFGYGNSVSYGANHGTMGGVRGMVIGGLVSGGAEAFGQETFQGVTGMWGGGGGGDGSMGLDGSDFLNSYVGDYF